MLTVEIVWQGRREVVKQHKAAKEKVANSSQVVLKMLVDVVGDLDTHDQVEMVDEEKVINRVGKIYYESLWVAKSMRVSSSTRRLWRKSTGLRWSVKLHRQPDGCGGEM